jgi:hypothetical protein
MNQTVQFVSPKFPVSFMLDEEVVKELFAKAKQAVDAGTDKTASQYVNRLVKWALENYNENKKDDLK